MLSILKLAVLAAALALGACALVDPAGTRALVRSVVADAYQLLPG